MHSQKSRVAKSIPQLSSLLPEPSVLQQRTQTAQVYKEVRPKWEADRANYSQARHLIEDFHDEFRRSFQQVLDMVEKRRSRSDTPLVTPEIIRAAQSPLQGLLYHHTYEDRHFFPEILRRAPHLAHEFERLEGDHQKLHPLEDVFLATTTPDEERAAALKEFVAFLNDHLIREEMLVVPVLMKHNVEKFC